MLDVNCPWSHSQARARAEELRDARLAWLEEPVWPPEDYDGLARLRAACGIPLAAGENVATLLDFDRLMAAGAVDFVQPSPAKIGGVTELCKVFPLAAARGVTVMPHTFYHGPGLLAAVHVTAALGTADSLIEWRHSDLEAWVYGKALVPEDGRIPVPQGPGLGIDPDPDVLRAFAADRAGKPLAYPGVRHGDGSTRAEVGDLAARRWRLPGAAGRAAVEAHCRFAGPEFATIAATGGMTSATADITTAATTE